MSRDEAEGDEPEAAGHDGESAFHSKCKKLEKCLKQERERMGSWVRKWGTS